MNEIENIKREIEAKKREMAALINGSLYGKPFTEKRRLLARQLRQLERELKTATDQQNYQNVLF